jgi:type IV pilus assembly protein PilW
VNTRTRTPRAGEAGFSLIEILVGVAIGLLGIIIMMQVLSLAQGTQRTTTAGGDAQNNAFIALDTLQRDITHAGNGFAHLRLLGCDIQLPNGGPVPLAPLIINPPTAVIPAGDAGSDRFLVAYGTGHDQPDGYVLDTPSAGVGYTTTSGGAIAPLDWLIHAPAACPLALRQVTAGYVAGSTAVTVAGVAAATTATALFNLGAAPRFLAYAVRSGTLAVCDYRTDDCSVATPATLANENIWRPLINNVASLRLQYGRDTSAPMDGFADTFNQTAPASACDWARVSAIRLVLATRGTQYDRNVVTPSANPPWLGDPDTNGDGAGDGGAGSAPLTLSGVTDWDHYRYRIFQTVIPLRNIAWMGVVTGC